MYMKKEVKVSLYFSDCPLRSLKDENEQTLMPAIAQK
jgi:hypothetical protein